MKPELCNEALKRVINPNILVNIISRRVRQLTSVSGGNTSRPLISETAGMGMADIALTELLEDKMGWELDADNPLLAGLEKAKKKKR